MSLFLPMPRFCDITETVVVRSLKTGVSTTVRAATQINPGKSETGFLASTSVPHVKTIWFLPMISRLTPQRGDRIIDRFGRVWIIVEPVPYDRFDSWRCRTVHETLTPGPNDRADLLNAAGIVIAAGIDAVPLNRDQSAKTTETVNDETQVVSTVRSVEEKIVFQVKTHIDLAEAASCRRKGETVPYNVVAFENAPIHSDWGKLTVQRSVESLSVES